MSGVQIPVEAKLNTGDIDAELKQLTQKINAVGQSIAQANKVKFNPIGKATLDDLKRVQAEFEKLKRTSSLGADISRTGQGGRSFFDLDWTQIAANSITREARRYGAFNRVVAGTGASFSNPAPPPQPSPSQRHPSQPSGGGSAWANAGRKIVGAGLRASGAAGGVADEAIGTGMSGGAMAGVAGLLGGIVALGVGKLVGGVMSKMGDAQTDMIGYDTLKRQLGDVNVGFSTLRETMHKASDAFDGTYQQTLRMGTEFAKIAGMSGKGTPLELAREVANAGGFARSFGLDLDESTRFFGTERNFGVTHNDRDSKRLALYIGEAVAKSGAFAKSDEMLQAIANYTTQQTRLGLASANVGGYMAALSGAVAAHIPGMDVTGAAGLLAKVNSSIAAGGGAGEAGQNFMYMSVGRQLGLDPILGAALREQGAFGTGAQEFGSGSMMARWAAINGVNIPGSASGSSLTNLSMLMRAFHKAYANHPQIRLSAEANELQTNISQAAFLDMLKPEQLGDVNAAIQRAGIDLQKLNPTAYSSLAQVALGDRGTLNGMAKDIWSKLPSDAQSALDKAGGGDTESLRKLLLQDLAKYGQGQTEGEQTRSAIVNLDKDMTDAAGKMIGPLNDMRNILLYAFGDHGRMSAGDIAKADYEARKGVIEKRYRDAVSKAQSEHEYGLARGAFGKNLGDEFPEIAANNRKAIAAATAAAAKTRDAELKELKGEFYPTPSTSSPGSSAAAPAWTSNTGGSSGSSSFDPISGGRKLPRNLRDNNPGNIKYGPWARKHGAIGRDGNFARFGSAQAGTSAEDALLQGYGRQGLNTVAEIVRKWAPASDGNDTAAYARDVAQQLGVGTGTPLNMSDPAVRHALGRAMSRHEGSADAYRGGTQTMNMLLSDYSKQHLNTIREIVSKFALSKGDSNPSYITDVSRQMGVGPDAPLNMSDPAVRLALGRAMSRHEGSAAAYQLGGTPLPNVGSGGIGSGQITGAGGTFAFEHHITLWDKNGAQAAPTTTINTNFSAPGAFGR